MEIAIGIVITLLALAILVWGGDRLLALSPGNEKLKQAARIVAIVLVALFCLSLIAGALGAPMPWNVWQTPRHR